MSETLLKSARQHFCANFRLILNKVSYATCLLVGSEMLGPSCNSLTIDRMYSCHSTEKFPQEVRTQVSSKPKTFSQTFIAFFKST